MQEKVIMFGLLVLAVVVGMYVSNKMLKLNTFEEFEQVG